jgi:hypothetical protein
MSGRDAVSPTAHYTGRVYARAPEANRIHVLEASAGRVPAS